jgi:hypothetical protein
LRHRPHSQRKAIVGSTDIARRIGKKAAASATSATSNDTSAKVTGVVTASLNAPWRQVSFDNAIGGLFWRRDGRELVFMSQPPKPLILAADVTSTASGVESGTPRVLFALPPGVGGPAQLSSVGTLDADRFVFALNLPPRPAR